MRIFIAFCFVSLIVGCASSSEACQEKIESHVNELGFLLGRQEREAFIARQSDIRALQKTCFISRPIEMVMEAQVGKLGIAVVSNNHEEAERILRSGINLDQAFRDVAFGQKAIHYSSLYADSRMLSLLIHYGADVHAIDSINRTALFYSLGNLVEMCAVFELLVSSGADIRAENTDGFSIVSIYNEKGLSDEAKNCLHRAQPEVFYDIFDPHDF